MADRVLISIERGIAEVRLNRADKRNALDLDMFTAIVSAQRAVRKARGVRAVVLCAEGEDFSSGLDVKALMASRTGMWKLMWKWWPWNPNLAQQTATGWRRLPVPVIAAVQGRCWGGGLQVALGADYRYAHPSASLSIMEGKWGLIPDMGGTLAFRELMPCDQAMRLAMTAEVLDAAAAVKLGLVSEISDDPLRDARALAAALAQRSPDAVRAVKRLYRKSWRGSEGSALLRETCYQWKVLAGPNQRIAVRRQQGEDIDFRD